MSEKVTFGELIDSISDETGRSKRSAHDFVKGLVTVIHEGLEEDRNVNIAGLGKFDLRRMEEREGTNPQTGEKMTIPAHDRVVFKPYKQLREQVNAPYADREPTILGDRPEEEDAEEKEFIPTAPPTERSPAGKAPSGEERESGSGVEPSSDSTIVEYTPEDGPDEINAEPETDRFDFRKSRRHESSGVNWLLIVAGAFVILILAAASYLVTYQGFNGADPAAESEAVSRVDPPAGDETDGQSAETEQPPAGDSGEAGAVSLRVESGQTLWSLAREEYGDPYLWPWIYRNNAEEIDSPDIIVAGETLSVPRPRGADESLTENDSLQVALGYTQTYRWHRSRGSEEARNHLYAATLYHGEVLDHTDISVDEEDLAFATGNPR